MGDLYFLWLGREYLMFRVPPTSFDSSLCKILHVGNMGKVLLPLRKLHLLSSPLSSLIQKMWNFLGGWEHIQRETRKYLSESIYSSIFRPLILNSYSCFLRREAHKGATRCSSTPSIVSCFLGEKKCVRACSLGP